MRLVIQTHVRRAPVLDLAVGIIALAIVGCRLLYLDREYNELVTFSEVDWDSCAMPPPDSDGDAVVHQRRHCTPRCRDDEDLPSRRWLRLLYNRSDKDAVAAATSQFILWTHSTWWWRTMTLALAAALVA